MVEGTSVGETPSCGGAEKWSRLSAAWSGPLVYSDFATWGVDRPARTTQQCAMLQEEHHCAALLPWGINGSPVRYFDNIVYRDNSTVIAIRYLQLAIVITTTKTVVGYKQGAGTE